MVNQEQVFRNIEICISCGIDKVFLINHEVTTSDILSTALKAKKIFPEMWVGINMLGMKTTDALSIDEPLIDGLWCDASISIKDVVDRNFKGMFFGGLAFKYQKQPKDLKLACIEATLTTDVATTSGPGTAKPAAIEKIKIIRDHLGDHPMAIASGVSVDNIESYIGLADYLLVASSITDDNEFIIEEKLKELKNKIK